jgi:resuscitation-promoting factor RpfA
MARFTLRRTTVLALTAATAGTGIVLAASPASADIYSSIRQCESGGNYSTNTGNGYYGAYQFSQSTWNSLGYSGVPSSASPATQDAAAAQLASRAGFGQWPVCGAGGGGATSSYTAPAQTYTQPTYTQPSYTGYTAASRDYTRPAIAPVADVYGFFSSANAGEVRDDVKLYQKTLFKKLKLKLKVDGQYGVQTELATLDFQKTHHLKLVDGVVGPETWKAVGLKAK